MMLMLAIMSMRRKTNTRRASWQPSGPQRENHVRDLQTSIKVPISSEHTMKIVLVGVNYEKIDYVDRARKKGDGPVIDDFESLTKTQHTIATVVKLGGG